MASLQMEEFWTKMQDGTSEERLKLANDWLLENQGHEQYLAVQFAANQSKKIADQSLLQLKKEFPVLQDATASLPHYPTNHCHADVTLVEIDRLAQLIADPFLQDGKLWEAFFVPRDALCDSESDVQILIVTLLEAILEGMGLDELVGVTQNRTLAGAECDVLLIYKRNRLPFAVIEAKKPGNSEEGRRLVFEGLPIDLGGNRVAGEVYAEMKAIQLFGYPTVTGMISTGNQWRVVGLGGDKTGQTPESYAESLKRNYEAFVSQNDQEELKNNGEEASPLVVSPGESTLDFMKGQETEDRPKKIWGGEIVPSYKGKGNNELYDTVKNSGVKIVTQLVFLVYKGCSDLYGLLLKNPNPLERNIEICKKMPCRILWNKQKETEKSKDAVFAFGTVQLSKLNLEKFHPTLEKIHVIRHLGIGDYGNVCLGVSEGGGSCCAIKFYHSVGERERFARSECENWNLVYGKVRGFKLPFVLKVAEGYCLVMPYLHPIPPERRHDLLDGDKISYALKKFKKSGYVHRDLKWRHFRLWKNGRNTDNLFLVDLGEASLLEAEHASETWIEDSIKTLRETA